MSSETGDSESEIAAESAARGMEEDALPGQGDEVVPLSRAYAQLNEPLRA